MGLSPRNLWNMKRFYERYFQADAKLLRSVAVLPWGHNLLLLDKISGNYSTALKIIGLVMKLNSHKIIAMRKQGFVLMIASVALANVLVAVIGCKKEDDHGSAR